jgi:hypothetical protein
MDVRVKLGSVVEWAVAALFLLASVGVASLALRELRATAAVNSPAAAAFAVEAPAGVADRAVSVQHLLLSAGKEVRVGVTLTEVANTLGRSAETGAERADIGPLGERVTRYYDYAGTRFALVFEKVQGQSRVTAIYIQ